MLKGAISKIRRKGGALMRRRLPSFRASRRKFRRYVLKPEVKWIQADHLGVLFQNKNAAVSSYASAALFTYPAQGTSDITRLGDTIRPVMILFRYCIYASTAADCPMWMRITIFTTNVDDQLLYFAKSTDRPAICGVIDNEKVTKVYYDKIICLNPRYYNSVTSKANAGGTGRFRVKIKLKKPIVFSAASTTPKRDSDNFRISCIGWNPYNADATQLGYLQGYARFYWSDA